MDRLSGLDAGFLYMETPTLHMHTLKIALLDPSEAEGGWSFDRFLEVLGERLHLLPPFRRRLVQDPLRLHHPVWIEDEAFDLRTHVRHIGVPPPGTMTQLDEVIGEIASHQLDRNHPLWELWVVEGLASGEVAFVTKMHHAMADGIAASALLANVMGLMPPPPDAAVDVQPWEGEVAPSGWWLTQQAFREYGRQAVELPGLVGKTVSGATAVVRRKRGSEVSTPMPILSVPKASFNGSLTPRRSFASTSLSLDDFRTVKTAFDVSINDVVLACASGALRRLLDRNGETLTRSLVAGVPTSTDTDETRGRLGGNRVGNLFTSLATDRKDPLERLHAIHEVTSEAKHIQNALGADMLSNWVQYAPPGIYAGLMRRYSKWGGADRHAPPINLVVSNVPGPREQLEIAGARLTGLFSVGPILEGIGLNITVWSYDGRMNVSAIACPATLPNLRQVVDDFADQLDEYLALAQ